MLPRRVAKACDPCMTATALKVAWLHGYRLCGSVAAGAASPPDCHSASAGGPRRRRHSQACGKGSRTNGRYGTPVNAAVSGPVNAAPVWVSACSPEHNTALGCPRLVLGCQALLKRVRGSAPNNPGAPPSLASLRPWGARRTLRRRGPRQARCTGLPRMAGCGGGRRCLALAGCDRAPRPGH